MSARIHPTAQVDPRAELGEGVEVGPFAIIEAGVTIGDRTRIGPHVHIQGTTVLGPDNVVHTGATLGFAPQYLGFKGEPTRLEIGARNTIREYCNIHRGLKEDSPTRIGDDCLLMGFTHIAHDCHVGNGVIMANGAMLAGHVHVGDRAFISGLVGVHQFCRVGRLAMVGGLSKIVRDVPPFMIVDGNPAFVRGVNLVGLRRAGVAGHVRAELKRLLHELYRSGRTLEQALAAINPLDHSDEGRELLAFYGASQRGVTPFILAHRRAAGSGAEESTE